MKLSQKAIDDLRETLSGDLGADYAKKFTDEDLEHIGTLLLTILAESLKMKCAENNRF